MRLLIVLLGIIACTAAHKCCPPKQFEGLMGQFVGTCTKSGQTDTYSTLADIHYDYKMAMVAATETIYSDDTQVTVQIIQDFGNKILYVIMQGKCTKSDLPGTIDDTCIPDSAVYGGTFMYGINALQGDMYTYSGQQMGANISANIVVTTKECLPFAQLAYVEQPEVKSIVNDGYLNVTLGIKDPSVFDIPKICQKNDVMIPFKAMGDLVSDRMKWVMSSFGAH